MNAEDLAERLLDFAVRVGKIIDALPDSRLGRHIAGQLVRSATSPAPNYAEACAAESRKDFAHKLSICLKELRELRVWLRMIVRSGLLPASRMRDVMDEADQLCSIMGSSIATARGKRRKTTKAASD